MLRKDKTSLNEDILRGDVYLVNLDVIAGEEIKKSLPAVVIQNNIGNKYSPVTLISPISNAKEISNPLPIMVFLKEGEAGITEDGYIDIGQIRTIDKNERLIKKLGSLRKEKIEEINKAIQISLAID
jgi:mRNA interferase MazF